MKNPDNKPPRKAHDTNTQIEEENLWDLEDDWDDETSTEDPSTSHGDDGGDLSDEDSSLPNEDISPTPDLIEKTTVQVKGKAKNKAKSKAETSPVKHTNDAHSDDVETENENNEVETVDQDEIDSETHDEPDIFSEIEADEILDDEINTAEESIDVPDDQDSSTGIKSEIDALISPLKKFSLSSAEKITLATLALIFAGLAIWGYVFLYEKNNLSETETALNLPIKGEYATVTKLSTYWISAGQAAGIKLGVAVVPVASITLDNASTSGALRIFFRDAEQNRVGDPITISFQDGQFTDPNKTNITITDDGSTATVSATNGFQIESDFSAYQMDSSLTWKVHVLEAVNSSAAGSDFEELFNTGVEPKRQ